MIVFALFCFCLKQLTYRLLLIAMGNMPARVNRQIVNMQKSNISNIMKLRNYSANGLSCEPGALGTLTACKSFPFPKVYGRPADDSLITAKSAKGKRKQCAATAVYRATNVCLRQTNATDCYLAPAYERTEPSKQRYLGTAFGPPRIA